MTFGTHRTEYDVTAIIAGKRPRKSIMRALGERESMGTTATGEDLWHGNKLTPAPTSHVLVPTPPDAGEQMTVVSEDANDTAAGTGARTVRICYLDGSGNQQEETVTLNGTTGVDTVATDIRFVNDFHAATFGDGGVPAGHIKIYAKSDSGLVYNMLHAGHNKSTVPHRMIPLGHRLLLLGWHAEEAQEKRCAFRLRSTDLDGTLYAGTFLFKDSVYMKGQASGELRVYAVIPALSIVKVTAWPDAVGAEGSTSWWGVLEDLR